MEKIIFLINLTFCPFVICYIFRMNNSDKNFRKTDLKNPTIDEKGNYHKANQIAYIPMARYMIIKTDSTISI